MRVDLAAQVCTCCFVFCYCMGGHANGMVDTSFHCLVCSNWKVEIVKCGHGEGASVAMVRGQLAMVREQVALKY